MLSNCSNRTVDKICSLDRQRTLNIRNFFDFIKYSEPVKQNVLDTQHNITKFSQTVPDDCLFSKQTPASVS